jgi:hypothetical protein
MNHHEDTEHTFSLSVLPFAEAHFVDTDIVHGRQPRLSVRRLAEPDCEKFKQVIERARERSKPFGTRIEIRDGMGVARPD